VKGVPNVSFYRTGFQARLPDIFADLNKSFKAVEERRSAEAFKQRVMCCFSAWEDWHLYPMDFLIKLQNIFLGLVCTKDDSEAEASATDEDVDGMPLDGAALLKGNRAKLTRSASHSDDSLDGAPINREDNNGQVSPAPAPPPGAFIKSKWETVDPEQVKAQAVTTSKWEREENDDLVKARKALMGAMASKWEGQEDNDSLDGEPVERDDGTSELDIKAAEERRQILRDIEVKVMSYQDELESGTRSTKAGWSIAEQVEHYRKKLLRKALEETPKKPAVTTDDRKYSEDSESGRSGGAGRSSKKKEKKRKRDRTTSSGSRSRSPRGDRGDRNRSKKKSSRRSAERSYSSSPERRKRDRSRTPKRAKRSRSKSPKKHKKKRR